MAPYQKPPAGMAELRQFCPNVVFSKNPKHRFCEVSVQIVNIDYVPVETTCSGCGEKTTYIKLWYPQSPESVKSFFDL